MSARAEVWHSNPVFQSIRDAFLDKLEESFAPVWHEVVRPGVEAFVQATHGSVVVGGPEGVDALQVATDGLLAVSESLRRATADLLSSLWLRFVSADAVEHKSEADLSHFVNESCELAVEAKELRRLSFVIKYVKSRRLPECNVFAPLADGVLL